MRNLRLLWVLALAVAGIGWGTPQRAGAQSSLAHVTASAETLTGGLSKLSVALAPLKSATGADALTFLRGQPELWVDPEIASVIAAVRTGTLDPGLADTHPALAPLLRQLAVVSEREIPLGLNGASGSGRTRLATTCDAPSALGALCKPLSQLALVGAPVATIAPEDLPARREAALAALGGGTDLGVLGIPLDPGSEVSAEALAALFERMNVEPLVRAGIRPVATSDWDRTLSKGSAPRAFLEFLIARHAFLPEANDVVVEHLLSLDIGLSKGELTGNTIQQNMELVAQLEVDDRIHWLDRLEVTGKAFKGRTPEQAEELAREFYYVGIPGQTEPFIRNLFPGARRVATALQRHTDFWVVTAGYDFLGRAGASALHVPGDHVVGTTLETENGVFTGRLETVVSRYGKENLVRERIGESPLLSFGDNPDDDTEMMKDALFGFMINPAQSFVERNASESLGFYTLRYPQDATDGFEPY